MDARCYSFDIFVKMKNLYQSLILLSIIPLSFNSLLAQDLKGIVLDSITNNPILGVNIHIKDKKAGTSTNKNGEFSLNHIIHDTDNDTLYFSHIGYLAKEISCRDLLSTGNTVLLSKRIQNVDEVKITSSQKRKPQLKYSKLASLKEGLYSFGALMLGSNIYVIGGNSTFQSDEALKAFALYGDDFLKKHKANFSWQNYSENMYTYDIQSDEWATSNTKFRKRAYHNINYYNNKIIVLGGKRLTANRKYELLDETIEIFDIKAETKTVDSTNPHQAINFASVVYESNLIVMGGSTKLKPDGTKLYSKKAHLLNLETGYWYELNEMPAAKEVKGVLVNNKIFLIGGLNTTPLYEIESYNITTGEWQTESHLYFPVERPALTYYDGTIYIYENGTIQTYDIESKNVLSFSVDLYLNYSELFVAKNKLLILGGYFKDEYSTTPSPYLYSIDMMTFK